MCVRSGRRYYYIEINLLCNFFSLPLILLFRLVCSLSVLYPFELFVLVYQRVCSSFVFVPRDSVSLHHVLIDFVLPLGLLYVVVFLVIGDDSFSLFVFDSVPEKKKLNPLSGLG